MANLREELERLGLSEYLEAFVAEGFDTWEAVLDITESDLNFLNVKIGHQRKVQRCITESRMQAHDNRPPIVGAKRKYIRHPKRDEHAPRRPPSAYVIFSNQVRGSLKDQDQQLSFTEIAKTVGERWQILPAEARETYQRQAEAGKEKHHAELAEYMKTLQYDTHQRYLEEFKAKHSASHHPASMPTNTHNYCDGQSVRKVSSAVLDHPTAERDRTELGLAANLPRSESSTAAAHSLLALNPTALEDPSLPTFASLGPATLPRWESYGLHPLTVTRSISEQNADLDIPTSSSSYNNLPTSGSTATPSVSVKSPLSLSFHDQPHPSGTHDGSSPAFPGSRGYVDVNCAGQFRAHTDGLDFPPVLLQLVPSLGPTLRPLDPPAQTSSSRQQPQETCLSSSFAALLRAGGLARIADAKTETSRLPSKSDCS